VAKLKAPAFVSVETEKKSNSTVLHNTLNQRYYGEEGRSGSEKNYINPKKYL
jgi:hypothetical protein